MTSQRSESARGDERSVHETHRKRPLDPDVINKAILYDYSVAIDPIGMQFGLVSYAVASLYLHFSEIDRTEGWVTLGDHKFKDLSHLSWLVRTFAFCFLEWLATLVEHERGLSKFRVKISSGWANIVYATGLFSTIVLLMDLSATARYLIVEFWRIEIGFLDNPQQHSDLLINLCWWYFMINFLVAAHYARRFYICMLRPLEGFVRAMKDQMRKERDLKRAADLTKMSTDKSGTAPDYLSPSELPVISADDLEKGRDQTDDPQRRVKPFNSSIILHLAIWLAVLHFTWPDVDLSENTSIFIYGACMSPRWWATAYSMYVLASVFDLGELFSSRTPDIQDSQDRSALELTNYFIQATIVITATILTVDLQWLAISVFYTRYLQLPPYQAGNSEVVLRWLQDSILVLVLYPVAVALCALAWQPLCYFKKTVRHYGKQIDQAHAGDKSHDAPCQSANVGDNSHDAPSQPAKSAVAIEKEEQQKNQQPAQSDARQEEKTSEDHDGGEALPTADVDNLVGNDWELVEDGLLIMDASDALAVAASAKTWDEGECH